MNVALHGIGVTLGERVVLRDITARLTEPRIGIVGRNGSGKTTLARVIAGLVGPDAGTARIDGIDMARDRRAALEQVGIIFQNPDHQIIFPTVLEEMAFGLAQQGRPAPDAEAGARAMLERFGKGHWANAATHNLSQGQKQLLCLMAVLAMGPGTVVMDEPFSGLDIPTRLQLMRYLDGIAAQVVMITHDPAQLHGFDRILWLEGGRLIADGPPAEILPAFEARMLAWEGWMISLTSPLETWAHRVPASVKLLALSGLTATLFMADRPGPLAVALLAIGVLYLSAGVAFLHHGLRQLRMLWPFLLLLAVWHGATGQVQAGAAIALRLVAALALANFVTMTTRLTDMVAVLTWLLAPLRRIGLPTGAVTLAIAMVLRFTPMVMENGQRLSMSWRARSRRKPGWRLVVPMAALALDDADHVAEALRARGGMQTDTTNRRDSYGT